MKLTILSCYVKNKGMYSLTLQYGQQIFTDELVVSEGVVPYVEYSEKLQQILHKDVGEARKMNQASFKIYRGELTDFPCEIGDFD